MRALLKMVKKAEIKIQEMAFVLLAVVLLFTLVLLIFARFQIAQLQESALELRREQAVSMLRVIASMPELRCSASFSSVAESACIDEIKLEAFVSEHERYEELWKNSKISGITIKEAYPEGQEYVIKSARPGTNTVTYATFIPLCEEQVGRQVSCKIATINIGIEE